MKAVLKRLFRNSGGGIFIGWSDVTVICGRDTISMLRGNAAYSVKFSGKDLSRC